MNKFFNCWPVIIYTALSVLQTIIALVTDTQVLNNLRFINNPLDANSTKGAYLVSQLVSTFIGYCILFWFCHNKYNRMAWVVLLLPVISMVISLIVSSFSKKQKEQFNLESFGSDHDYKSNDESHYDTETKQIGSDYSYK